MRPKALLKLLQSVKEQTVYPNAVLIIDGSTNLETETLLQKNIFNNLSYFKVEEKDRGLTKQRNFGINQVSRTSEVVCFLDDDVVLTSDYFEQVMTTYTAHPEALGVSGYVTNEVTWEKANSKRDSTKFYYDGWERKEPSRFKLRRKFGLLPDSKPGVLPSFSHGRSMSFLPPTGKVYPVDLLVGCVFSFKRVVFEKLKFSIYFEGYGLYEDADFSLRVSKIGNLYVNTNARLEHYHDSSGRPNKYNYGKMVIRNGWYVWRVKYPKPNLKARIKWNATACMLVLIRVSNIVTTNKRKEALTESFGRFIGWLSLLFNRPKIKY